VAFAQKNEMNSPNVQGILTFDTTSQFSTGNSFADMLQGNIASYKQWNQAAKYYNRYKLFEPYFQDDWRVTKKLTLNLGCASVCSALTASATSRPSIWITQLLIRTTHRSFSRMALALSFRESAIPLTALFSAEERADRLTFQASDSHGRF